MAKIRVWNSKAQKHHYIHPDLAKDKVFMQQRGMILDPVIKPVPAQATAPTPVPPQAAAPVDPKPVTKTKTPA